MEITSNGAYPSRSLSNFAGHRFTFDDVECNSMEGFLQSLKWKSTDMQPEICKLVGIGAKRRGYKKNWWTKQELYWKGKAYPRKSKEYKELIAAAYDALFECSESFRNALKAAGKANFTHNIGKIKEHETILTRSEFINNLNRLRDNMGS